jgi:hypothetical protein
MTKTAKVIRFPNGEVYPHDSIWADSLARGDCELLTGKEGAQVLEDHRRAELLELVPVGATLTVVCTAYNNRSGTAKYKVFVPAIARHDGSTYIRNITRMIAQLVGFRLSKDDEIIMGGWGYSKSFQIGYSLGRMLWPNGTPEPHGTRNGEPDRDGGYAINVTAH